MLYKNVYRTGFIALCYKTKNEVARFVDIYIYRGYILTYSRYRYTYNSLKIKVINNKLKDNY